MKARRRDARTGILAALAILPFLSVFGYMVLVAFQRPLDITAGNLWPSHGPTLDNFGAVFETGDFLGYILNSLGIGLGSTLISLAFGLPAAFALAHWRLRRTSLVFLLARMLPGVALVVPWFVIATQLDMIDSYPVMVLSHVFITMPFITWMMIPFFEELPKDIFEAALVDGAGHARFFFGIALPLVSTGVAAASILAFIFSWNQFLFAVVLSGRTTATVPVAVFNFLSYGSNNWGQIAAAAVVITLPVVGISLLVQRWIVSGLTAGAVKG